MRITVIYGSPRSNSNTKALLDIVTEEVKNAGIEADYYDVYNMSVSGCRACLGCQADMSGVSCVIDDDMQPILESIKESEAIVIAAPIYAWSVPAPVKAVIDRMAFACCKYYGVDPFGPSYLKGKKLYIITTCGYPVEKGADLHEEAMKRLAKHCKMEYGGMLAARHKNMKEPFMDADKEAMARNFAKKLL